MKKLVYASVLGGILALLPSVSSALAVWDAVQATGPLNVRQTPSISGAFITEKPTGSKGVITGGPIVADGYTWWLILWEDDVGGFSADINLAFYPPVPTIFADRLGLGWHENQWPNTSSNFTSTTSRVGTHSIATTTTAVWARLYIQTNGISTSGYNSLRFSVRSQSSAGQILYVALYNTGGAAIQYLEVFDYVSGGSLSPNTWYDVRIPLADLAATNQTIGGFVVESAQPTTFYVDDVALDAVSGSTYWNPSPPPQYNQAGAIVYGQEVGWGWQHSGWSNVTTDLASPMTYAGPNAIKVTTGAQWGRLQLTAQSGFAFNTASYNTLIFALNIGKYEGEVLYVGLIGSNGSVIQYASLGTFTGSGTLDAYQWQPVSIPLSALGVSGANIFGVEIQSSNPSTFNVDEIVFLNTSGGSCNVQ